MQHRAGVAAVAKILLQTRVKKLHDKKEKKD
jgi:hypothetical protein